MEKPPFAPGGAQRIGPKERYGYGMLRTNAKHGDSSGAQYDMQQANHFPLQYTYNDTDMY